MTPINDKREHINRNTRFYETDIQKLFQLLFVQILKDSCRRRPQEHQKVFKGISEKTEGI